MHSDQRWGVSSHTPTVDRRMQGLKIKADFDATLQSLLGSRSKSRALWHQP